MDFRLCICGLNWLLSIVQLDPETGLFVDQATQAVQNQLDVQEPPPRPNSRNVFNFDTPAFNQIGQENADEDQSTIALILYPIKCSVCKFIVFCDGELSNHFETNHRNIGRVFRALVPQNSCQ